MRERLAAAFVLLAVLVLLIAGGIRAWSVQDLVRDQESQHLRNDVQLVTAVLVEHEAAGEALDETLLASLVRPDSRLEFVDPGGGSIVVTGTDFESQDDVLTSEVMDDIGTVRLTTGQQRVAELYSRELFALVMMILLVSLLAGLAGWWAARRLAEPFRALAGAAAALGRGRFDLRLPETRIPEAQAIGQALRVSAAQLEARLSRERDFAEHASHQLRTPLTSLRLELEDLTLRSDVPDDVKEAALRCITQVESVNTAAGELVSLSRQGVLVEGGQVMLGELATQITQAWSDRLATHRRTVTARAEGELDQLFTPGPLEQILDVVIEDVVRGSGPVRLVFEGSESHVRVVVPAGAAGDGPLPAVDVARGLALPQGGRLDGDLVRSDLEILMPRR